jgi:putative oxidoreductase
MNNRVKNVLSWLNHPPTDGPRSILYLRVMAGAVFFWEGILKFVYANQGIGRFTKLGMPFPHVTADSVAILEIVGGLLLLSGLLTRWISVLFIGEMIVAIFSTKITLFLGTYPLPLPSAPPRVGIWAVLHEVRSEYAQALVSAFLLINGPGRWALDAVFHRTADSASVPVAGARLRQQAGSAAMI